MITGTGLFFVVLFATIECYPIRRRCSNRNLFQAKSARRTRTVILGP